MHITRWIMKVVSSTFNPNWWSTSYVCNQKGHRYILTVPVQFTWKLFDWDQLKSTWWKNIIFMIEYLWNDQERKSNTFETRYIIQNVVWRQPFVRHIVADWCRHIMSVQLQIFPMNKSSLWEDHAIGTHPPNWPPPAICVFVMLNRKILCI